MMKCRHYNLILIFLLLGGGTLHATTDPGIKFVENKGQFMKGAYYAADIPGGNIYLGDHGFTYLFYDTEALHKRHEGYVKKNDYLPTGAVDEGDQDQLNIHVFNTEFLGSNIAGHHPLIPYATAYNYFYGKDPESWVSKARAYGKIDFQDLYELIDLNVYSQGYNMKYDLIIKEGGDPGLVKVKYTGLEEMYLSEGSLMLKTSVNEIQEYQPLAYQVINGARKQVACEYILNGNVLSYNFPLGYDKCYDLIIDPILIFSTYSGSPADNWGNTATFGEHGKLYSGGITNHFRNGNYLGEFPATPGAYQTNWAGIWDIAILKYDSAGQQVEYATYLGGSGSEVPHSLIMNNQEQLVIFGTTNSTDFPVTAGAYLDSFQGGSNIGTILGTSFTNGSDCYIATLSKDGSALVASTYFGGSGNDGLNETGGALTKNYGDQQRGEVFVDGEDNVYIAGSTGSEDLFTDTAIPSFKREYGGGITDAFATKLNSSLTNLNWGSYIGGSLEDAAFSLKVGEENKVYVAGGTASVDFPQAANDSSTYSGNIDGWVVLIPSSGDSLLGSRIIGTSSYDQTYFVDIDSDGDIYLLGQTRGNYPVTPGKYTNGGGGQFIHKLSPDLEQTIFTTMFGSPGRFEPNISPTAFLVNDCDNLYIAGWGNDSGNFNSPDYVNLSTLGLPSTSDAEETTTDGQDFYLMALDADATSLLYATFFGGSTALVHVDGGTSRFDKKGIVYHSVCASCYGGSTFPTSPGAWSDINGASGGCNNAAFKFDLASLRARIQTNSVNFDQPGLKAVCMPDDIIFQNKSIGGEIYEWNFGDGTEITRSDTVFITHNYKQPGNYVVSLKAIDPNTCIGEDITSTIVNVFKPSFIVSEDSDLCEGDNLRLTASGGATYHWISEDSTFTSNEASPLVMPVDTTTYFVTMTDARGCPGSDTVTVNLIPRVDVNFAAEKINDCFSRPTLQLTNLTQEGDDFEWDLGDGFTSREDILTHNYDQDGRYTIKLIGTRKFCAFEKEVILNFNTIKVPNVFTPTVKGHNDYFEIQTGDRKVDLKIYNRWGKLLFQQDNYQNTWQGEGLSAGVYYYEADIEEESSCMGWVQIIK